MQIDATNLNNINNLMTEYKSMDKKMMSYFDYEPFGSLSGRLNDIREQTYDRQALGNALYTMNEAWHAPEESLNNIDLLLNEDSVVVVGGQQAGLLTGPLYTINKIISIIVYAKQKEEKLNVPVVPIFWIAGEDHDIDEVNHIYIKEKNRIKKHILKQHEIYKRPLSSINLNKTEMEEWINEAFLTLKETQFTKDILNKIMECLQQSETFVDFFARCIFELFPSKGIVLLDAAHPMIRKIESPMFVKLIEEQEAIGQAVFKTRTEIQQNGYPLSLDVEQNDAHLFYHDEQGERILLKKNGQDWVGKQNEVKLTTKEILSIAREHPEKLSNNVITRPLMQEFLLPTLAFIGGHGEIAYWATLKKAFHQCQMNMPPVIPRLSFTFMTNKTKKILNTISVDANTVINKQLNEKKMNWLSSQEEVPVDLMVEQLKRDTAISHQLLQDYAARISPDMGELAKSNMKQIEKQLNFLQNKLNNKKNEKYELQLRYYDQVEGQLLPNEQLQERMWSPLQLINEYGVHFIEQLTNKDFSFEKDHYFITF